MAFLALLLDCVGFLVVVFAMFLVWEYFPKNDVSRYNLWVGRVVVVVGPTAAVGAILGPWLVVRAKRPVWSPSAVRLAPWLGPASLGGGVLGFVLLGLGTLTTLQAVVGPLEHNSLWDLAVVLAGLAGAASGAIAGPLFTYAAGAAQQ